MSVRSRQIADLNERIRKLSTKLIETGQENENLSNQCSVLASELENRGDNKFFQLQIKELKDQLAIEKSQNRNSSSNGNLNDQRVEALNRELSEAKAQCVRYEDSLKLFKSRLEDTGSSSCVIYCRELNNSDCGMLSSGKENARLEAELFALRIGNVADVPFDTKEELQNAKEDASRLQKEISMLKENLEKDYMFKLANEVDYQFNRHKMEMKSLANTLEHTKQELESSRMQAASSREHQAKSSLDHAQLRDSLRYAEIELSTLNARVSQLTQDKIDAHEQLKHTEKLNMEMQGNCSKLESEKKSLQKDLEDARADLEAYLHASHGKSSSLPVKRQAELLGTAKSYFDESESSINLSTDVFYGGSAGQSKVGKLELVAAQSVALIILEEFSDLFSKSNMNAVKEQCVKAALRIMLTAVEKSRQNSGNLVGEMNVSPLAILGDRSTIASIVAETKVIHAR